MQLMLPNIFINYGKYFSPIPSTKKHEVRKIKKMYVKIEKKKFTIRR